MRFLLALAPLAALASCTSVIDDPFLKTGALDAGSPSIATSVSPEYALAALPGIATTSVRQTARKDFVEQVIVLDNRTTLSGENTLTVTTGDRGIARHAPTASTVAAEMRSVLGGLNMSISPVIAENAYGVFGYATGSLGRNGSCIYAWQLARNTQDGARFGGPGRYPADIRLRYCTPTLQPDRTATLMQGLRLKPVTSRTVEALRHAAGSGAGLAAAVAPIEPAQQPRQMAEPPQNAIARPVRRKPQPVTVDDVRPGATAPAADAAIGNAAKVPLPGEVASHATQDVKPAPVAAAVAANAVAKPQRIPMPSTVAVAVP